MKQLIFLILGLLSQALYAQDAAMWRDYLPFGNVKKIVITEFEIVGITDFAAVKFDLEDKSISTLTRINGLSEVAPTALGYSDLFSKTIIGHADGTIDIIQNNQSNSLLDVKRASIFSSKQINEVVCKNNLAYLACGFGVVVMDVANERILDTWIIGDGESFVNVKALYFVESDVYAVTPEIIYKSNLQNSNVRNYLGWTKVGGNNPSVDFDFAFKHADTLYAVDKKVGFRNDTVYFFNELSNQWDRATIFLGEDVNDARNNENGLLVVANSTSVEVYDSQWQNVRRVFSYGDNKGVSPNTAVMKGELIAIGDQFEGMAVNYAPFNTDLVYREGPASGRNYRIKSIDENLYVATGQFSVNFQPFEFYKLEGGQWENFEGETFLNQNTGLTDLMAVVKSPTSETYYASSYISGVARIEQGKILEVYNAANSNLPKVPDPRVDFTRVADLAYDNDGVLWALSAETDNILSRLERNTWQNFTPTIALPTNIAQHLVIDRNNTKWIVLRQGGLLAVSDLNGNALQYKLFNTNESTGALPSIGVNDVAEDRNGEIWIGTDDGIAVIYNASNVFNSQVNAQRVFVQQDGRTQYLFESQRVNAIEVNGANQKWMAISGAGVFLMSADGTEQLAHFTKENSPLFSNNVLDIAILPHTGEVFFSTDRGLVSYRGDVTEPTSDYNDLNVFPNPVVSRQTLRLAVNGLVSNSTVKVTDVAGNLVYEEEVAGGQFSWNMLDLNGREVINGVYLIFAINADGSQSGITKVLISR